MKSVDYGDGLTIDWTERQYGLIKQGRARRMAEAEEGVPADPVRSARLYHEYTGLRERVDTLVEDILKRDIVC